MEDLALITENMNSGTSRNTGSDKQTYYKLSLAGDAPDSVRRLSAQILYEGGCVDGEHALCEAALSCQGFFKLVELGVRFLMTASDSLWDIKQTMTPMTGEPVWALIRHAI